MAATQYYVYSVDTSTGISYTIETTSAWNGPGVLVGGPYPTKAAAQAVIEAGGAAKGLSTTILAQDQKDVGDWIVVPEGEAGDIINALSAGLNSNLLSDVTGLIRGDLNTGGAATYTVSQLTTATQVQNAETANLTLYPSKAAAQAQAATQNAANAPSTGPGSNPLAGLAAIGDFFANLSEANTWIRVGEAVLGIILIAVGVAHMTNAVPAATKIARAVA